MAGHRRTALALLHELVERRESTSSLSTVLGDALVATASGTRRDRTHDAALQKLKEVDDARERVIHLLRATPFGQADRNAIRAVLDSLDAAARADEERTARADLGDLPAGVRRVGSVWLELKYIPDSASGRTYGTYLYARWREAQRKRSRYLGKVPVPD